MALTDRGIVGAVVPAGIRVLAVDCDGENLSHLSSSLGLLGYEVRTCETAKEALWLLRQNPEEFNMVLAEAFSPEMDMDGFKLLGAVMSEFQCRVQVVLFSSFCSYNEAAMRALKQGASAFYTKPIPIELLQHLWQHAFPQKVGSFCDINNVILETPPPPTILPPPTPSPSPSLTTTRADREKRKRKRNDYADDDDDDDDDCGMKRSKKEGRRVCWLPELHDKFVAAVEVIIGTTHNLTPRKILDVMEKMGVVGLTVQQVSSHLQQYRKRTLFKSPNKSSSSSSPSSSAELLQDSNYNSSLYSDSTFLVPTTSDVAAVASASDLFSSHSQLEISSIQQNSSEESSHTVMLPEASPDWLCLDLSDLGVDSEEILNLLECN